MAIWIQLAVGLLLLYQPTLETPEIDLPASRPPILHYQPGIGMTEEERILYNIRASEERLEGIDKENPSVADLEALLDLYGDYEVLGLHYKLKGDEEGDERMYYRSLKTYIKAAGFAREYGLSKIPIESNTVEERIQILSFDVYMSLPNYTKAREILIALKDRYRGKGIDYIRLLSFVEARIEQAKSLLKELERGEEDLDLCGEAWRMGDCYFVIGDYRNARKYYSLSHSKCENAETKVLLKECVDLADRWGNLLGNN